MSARYGYTLAIPEGWELTAPATTTWAGSGPWRTGETDVYANAGAKRTFEVAARSVPEGLGAFDFVGRYVPRRGGADEPTCGYNGGPITGPYIAGAGPVWAEVRPEPRRTLVRATCEVVDAVVFIDATAYVMKLSQTGLQLWAFDELLSALSFDEPPIAFNSARYGYSIELTQDWQTAPAIRDWTGTGRPAAPMTDAFIDPRAVARFTIAARTKPAETTEDRFVADAAPLPANVRLDGSDVRCVFGGTAVERGPIPPWETEVIGGHLARVRSMCGTVDAVVFVGDRGYLITLVSGERTVGDLERFRQLVASVRFDDGRTTFVSDGYGYSIRYPGDWQVTPASRPWDGTDAADDGMDRFLSSGSGRLLRFSVAAKALPGFLTEDDWIEAYVPRIQAVFGKTCRFGQIHVLAPAVDAAWQPAQIDGLPSRLRAACGTVDGVVFADGIGYWLRLSTPSRQTGGDRAAFESIAASMDLGVADARLVGVTDSESDAATRMFASKRYRYTIRIPAEWTAAAASKRWTGTGPWVDAMADQFAEPVEVPRRFSVTARSLGGDVIDDAWLDAFVPDPSTIRGTICRQADGTPRSILRYMSAGRTWREAVVAGRPARLRGLCGQEQAVLQVGDTAFVLTLFRSDADEWAFRQIADTFRIAP